MNPEINLSAALDAETTCQQALTAALDGYGEGYVGAPRLTGGELAGVNSWWFSVGGGATTRLPNAPIHALDMDAVLEGVFADRQRAWKFAFAAMGALPIRGGIVQTCYCNGNPTNTYEYFVIAGREGQHGLWHAVVPLRIAFNVTQGVYVS